MGIKSVVYRGSCRVSLLVRSPESVKTIDSTVRLHRAGTLSFFRITDKLLPFDLLSILILDKLCMNL